MRTETEIKRAIKGLGEVLGDVPMKQGPMYWTFKTLLWVLSEDRKKHSSPVTTPHSLRKSHFVHPDSAEPTILDAMLTHELQEMFDEGRRIALLNRESAQSLIDELDELQEEPSC